MLEPNVDLPFRLLGRQYIDFTDNFETGISKLRTHIRWLSSPKGILQHLQYRMDDAKQDLHREKDQKKIERINDEIQDLEKQIELQKQIISNPEKVHYRVEQSVKLGLERERQPKKIILKKITKSKTTSEQLEGHIKIINFPPGVSPEYFQDREKQTNSINNFLKNDSQSVMTIVGRGGTGKTVVICRLLKAIENKKLLDGMSKMDVDAIVYLSMKGARHVSFENIYWDLCKIHTKETVQRLENIYKSTMSIKQKVHALLESFQKGKIIVLLDNLELLMNNEMQINNVEVDETIRAILSLPVHRIKIIITTRVTPKEILLFHPERQDIFDLEGLEMDYAENILREMDRNERIGLKNSSVALLKEASKRTDGNPRALEALFAILSVDRNITLSEILSDVKNVLPENVTDVLVGEAFSRLDASAQKVMEALAIYSRPVSSTAVDYLLKVFAIDSAPILNRLLNMKFIRKESRGYFLHPIDQDYSLSRISKENVGENSDDYAEYEDMENYVHYTQKELRKKAADYFVEIRKPREEWKSMEDLFPHMAEFELRCKNSDHNTAVEIVFDIYVEYFLRWGYHHKVVQMLEPLKEKITSPEIKMEYLSRLGLSYNGIGKYNKGVDLLKQSLDIAKERYDSYWKEEAYSGLGLCYLDLGNIKMAMENFNKTLEGSRERRSQRGEAIALDYLGRCYLNLGNIKMAMENFNKTLDMVREEDYRYGEAIALEYLGRCYLNLGNIKMAMENFEMALQIVRDLGNQFSEGITLMSVGHCYLNLGQTKHAIDNFNKALPFLKERGVVSIMRRAYESITLGYMAQQNYVESHIAITEASKYDHPLTNHRIFAILGIIGLIQDKSVEKIFVTALNESENLLVKTPKNYSAFDTKGLALCGLALCKNDRSYVAEAITAFKTARKITNDMGIVNSVLFLFDEITKTDSNKILSHVRSSMERT